MIAYRAMLDLHRELAASGGRLKQRPVHRLVALIERRQRGRRVSRNSFALSTFMLSTAIATSSASASARASVSAACRILSPGGQVSEGDLAPSPKGIGLQGIEESGRCHIGDLIEIRPVRPNDAHLRQTPHTSRKPGVSRPVRRVTCGNPYRGIRTARFLHGQVPPPWFEPSHVPIRVSEDRQ
ncbi:hypothetical protein ACQPZQ_16190 [Pseudonocardia sp. CA-142604]|uniref:hypothetical protein n=1 Tax=Pseudonocardia sp. CA-142604 TaxID=3240024 RepID=UPI003D93BBC4